MLLRNWYYPVVGIERYKSSLVILRQGGKNPPSEGNKRREIKVLSRQSRNRLVFLLANSTVRFTSMMTLTYGLDYPVNGQRVKSHLNRFIGQSKRLWGKFEYAWFLEFQKRGAPHFHIMTTLTAPASRNSVKLATFAQLWADIAVDRPNAEVCLVHRNVSKAAPRPLILPTNQVQTLNLACYAVHNHLKSWEAIRVEDGAARYVAKYATKTYQKDVPKEYWNVGRFWGMSHGVKKSIKAPVRIDVEDEREAKEYVALQGRSDVAKWECLPKIIFV